MSFTPTEAPHYTAEFYSDEFIVNPFPHYAAMRKLGAVVYLPTLGNYAVTRYKEVKEALRNPEAFSSAQGVAADQFGCDFLHGNTLASDAPVHDAMRTAMAAPLLPGALSSIRERIEQEAEALVDRLLQKTSFDGVADLARHLPLSIVTELIGLSEGGRDNLLEWAAGSFDILGIQNERGRRGFETIKGMRQYITSEAVPGKLKPGSWTARIHELAAKGEIPQEMCGLLIRDYINPSLDTTISATGQLFYQLGRNPEQWDAIRDNPALIPGAVNEAVRLGSPIRSFSRSLTRDTQIAGLTLPGGARVMMMFASANRDERQFPDPDRFDPTRPGGAHVGFGHGIHQCVGMHLARLEMESLLKAMIERVGRFVVGEPQVALNNTIYGFSALPMRLVAAKAGRAKPQAVAQPSSGPTGWRDVLIEARKEQANGVFSFNMVSADGACLPAFEAGSHVDVEVSPGVVRQYSLCNAPAESAQRYRIAVLREAASRGGSHGIHEGWQVGQVVKVGVPRNTFRLDETARNTILIAGGIGITPLLSMAFRLKQIGRPFVLHHCARNAGKAAFRSEIKGSELASHVELHLSDGLPEQRFSVKAALGAPAADTNVYCCGPVGFMDAVTQQAIELGCDAKRLHLERFGVMRNDADEPFTLVAHRSGLTLEVTGGRTILEVLTEAGVHAPSSCCAGVCATCLTGVISGVPDHRDMVMTTEEKAANRRIAVCCSRSLSQILVLDV